MRSVVVSKCNLVEVEPNQSYTLDALVEGGEPVSHIFAQEDIDVVNAALVTRRPVLLRGEPGIGKSQLARAVAQLTGRGLVSVVVDARTEPRDLLYRYDAVRRLGEAQVLGRLEAPEMSALDEGRFVCPGPLWWAFSWTSAETQLRRYERRSSTSSGAIVTPWTPKEGFDVARDGVVVLIDEIDKADPSVPNGLLEALGQRTFSVMGQAEPVRQIGQAPLVVITSNEERTLPGAFLRRCWVREIGPEGDLHEWFTRRGRAHFSTKVLADDVLEGAVKMLIADRTKLKSQHLNPPGQAELIDLLKALVELAPEVKKRGESLEKTQIRLLDRIGQFALKKHPKAQII